MLSPQWPAPLHQRSLPFSRHNPVHVFIVGLMGMAFPWGILSIYVIGSTAMGFVTGWFAFKAAAPADVRLFSDDRHLRIRPSIAMH
jgi:hypothetical protein